MEALHCLLCLKRVDNDERSNYNCFNEQEPKGVSTDTLLYSKFLKFVREYLKIEGDDNPLFSKPCSVGLRHFCGCCESVLSTVCRLYSDLLEVQLRLSWKLGELGELLEGSEKRVSNKLWNVLIRLVAKQLNFNGGAVVEATHVNQLRSAVKTICSQKGKDNLPSILVERISVPIESFPKRGEVDDSGSFSVLWITQNDDKDKTPQEDGHSSSNSEAIFNRAIRPSSSVENDDDADIKVEVESVLGHDEDEDHFNSDCWDADATIDNRKEDEANNACAESLSSQSFRRITHLRTRRSQKVGIKECRDDDDNNSDCSATRNTFNGDNIKVKEDSDFEVDFDYKFGNTSSDVDSGSDWETTDDLKKSKNPKIPSQRTVSRCDECGKKFKNEHRLKYHNQNVHKCVKCKTCGLKFNGLITLRDHKTKVHLHDAYFPCPDCGRQFSYLKRMKRHMVVVHKRNAATFQSETTSKSLMCQVCGKLAINKQRLESHLWIHKSIEEKRLVGKLGMCEICGKECRSLKSHMKLHETKYGERIEGKKTHKLKCGFPSCTLTFREKEIRQQHVERDHVPLNQYEFLCVSCGRVFVNEERLQTHLKQHFGEKDFECQLCSKRFSYKATLESHVRDIHGIGKPVEYYSCEEPQCGRQFKRREKLSAHKKVAHNAGALRNSKRDPNDKNWKPHKTPRFRPIKCMFPHCCSSFEGKENEKERQEHVQKEHCNSNEYEFVCRFCGRVFSNQERLDTHKRVHEGGKEKPWKCEQCPRSYFNKCTLDTHVKEVHELEQESFPCDQPNCGRICKSLEGFRKHRRKAHNVCKSRRRGEQILSSDTKQSFEPS